MTKQEFIKSKIVAILLLILSVLLSSFPWERFRNYEFVDLGRNLDKYDGFRYLEFNIDFSKITSEPVWTYLNYMFSHAGYDGVFMFTGLAVFCYFSLFRFVYIETKNLIYCLLLINPLILDFVLSQQRSCLALVTIIHCRELKLFPRIAGNFFSLLLHTLTAVIVFIDELSSYFFEKIKNKLSLRLCFVIAVSFVIAFLTVYGREVLLGFFNDRRAYEYDAGGNSILYSLPWLLYGLFIVVKSNSKFSIISSIYLMIFFWCSYFDFYGSRYLAIGMPFFYIALHKIPKNTIFFFLVSSHQVLLLYIWLKI
ncbi:membrane hypothetical protein [Vibrio chagasii]|nr:membrane hypothetical protein [Vibrio chagasii]